MKAFFARWLGLNETPGAAPRRGPRWLRPVSRLLGLLLIILSLYYLVRVMLDGIQQAELQTLSLAPGPIAIILALTVLCVWAGGWAWQLILRAYGYPLPLDTCLRIQVTSNLAKYIPGYAWQLVGKAYLTRREQVPTAVVTCAMILEFGFLLLTGTLVGLICMPTTAVLPLVGQIPLWARGVSIGLLTLVILGFPRLMKMGDAAAQRKKYPWLHLPQHPRPLWGAMGILFCSWVILGIGLGVLIRSVHAFPWDLWPASTYSVAISFLVSLMVLFVPSGIGVREGVMTWTLGNYVPAGVAVVVAILSRLVSVAAEFAAFGLYWVWQALRRWCNRSITRKD